MPVERGWPPARGPHPARQDVGRLLMPEAGAALLWTCSSSVPPWLGRPTRRSTARSRRAEGPATGLTTRSGSRHCVEDLLAPLGPLGFADPPARGNLRGGGGAAPRQLAP